MGQHYSWQRYWLPRESHIDLFDGGYLPDPDSRWWQFIQQPPRTLNEILEQMSSGCIVLLGEPGTGKTTTIKDALQQTEKRIKQKGNTHCFFNLSNYGSEDRFVRDLFESPTFRAWEEGDEHLTLILDAFDECLLRIDTVVNILSSKLEGIPIERLLLCIACRTAVWPAYFEQTLQGLWKHNQQSVGIYTLAPLRQQDVREVAQHNGITNPETFIQKVSQAHIVPFAIKPLTLDIVLLAYQQTGLLLTTQQDIYYQGCLKLCTEKNTRNTPLLKGKLSPQERLIVAARLAAIMLFTNTSAIWKGENPSEQSETDLLITQCLGYTEEGEGKQLHVTFGEIEEVLDTGLFTSHGPTRLKWAHKTYAEFLGAYYLTQHNLPPHKRESLIIHPDDPGKKIIPQLNETAAWLATMQPDLFSEIVHRDPEALIESNVITTGEKERYDLIAALFQGDEEQIQGVLRLPLRTYAKLAHEQMAQQLLPYIQTATYPLATRLLAINMADACVIEALQDTLVSRVLDPSEALQLREDSAHAIVHIGNSTTKAQLKTFALHNHDDDENDQLKGYGLQATWPDQMTTQELLSALTPPKETSFFGSYQAFLASLIADDLQTADILQALAWIEKQQGKGTRPPGPHEFSTFQDAIMIHAWKHLNEPLILDSFSKVLLTSMRHFNSWIETDKNDFSNDLKQDNQKRHSVLFSLFTLMATEPDHYNPYTILTCKPRLFFTEDDISWLLDQLNKAEATEEILSIMAQLIMYTMNIDDAESMNTIVLTCEHSSILANTLAPCFHAVELNSSLAQRMKEMYQQTQQQQTQTQTMRSAPPKKRILSLLQDCVQSEQTDITVWAHLMYELTFRADGSAYADFHQQDRSHSDIFPGWDNADAELKERLRHTATRYLTQYNKETSIAHREDEVAWNTPNWITYTRYKTVQLLAQESSQSDQQLSRSTWEQVSPAILHWCNPQSPVDQQLLTTAYRYAPSQVRDAVLTMLEELNPGTPSRLTSIIEVCWDDQLAHLLLTRVQEPTCPLEIVENLLPILLRHQVPQALNVAISLIPISLPDNESIQSKALVAAQALLATVHDAGWTHLWPVIQTDATFGQRLVSHLGTKLNIARMTDQQIADLYLWLVQHVPPVKEKQEHTSAARVVGTVDRLRLLPNNLISSLQQRGTFSACAAIRFLIKELPEASTDSTTPDLPYLPAALSMAQTLARRNTWLPLYPHEFLQLIHQSDTRLVENGDQLLEVVLASLERLEATLQGETPAAIDLWNESSQRKTYTPKDENRFSDYVKRHLDQDIIRQGIVVNREVELRPSTNKDGTHGERTDIHVDAVIQRPTASKQTSDEIYDSITVIIETKGCWHPELKTAMQTQLVERYLTENPSCHHGLYLIGWFDCPQWDSTDSRQKQTQRLHLSVDEARHHFAQQAHDLSQGDVHVKTYVMNTTLGPPSKKSSVQGRRKKTSTNTSSLPTHRNRTRQ